MTLRRVEWAVVFVITGLAVYLHLVFFKYGGALWRDEINSVSIANLPTVADVWSHIEFDSFPIFWLLVLRTWTVLVGQSDFLYRLLGFGIGVSILVALWFNARVFKLQLPILSVALVGFSPAIIRWGDSMRGYGLGIVSILFTVGFVWRMIERTSLKNTALATLSALIAAQSLYYNSVLIFALCLAGGIVAVKNRKWDLFFLLMVVGGVSALSLLPYISVFARSARWAPIFQYPDLWRGFRLDWAWKNLSETLNAAGLWVAWVWVGLFAGAYAYGAFELRRTRRRDVGRDQIDLAIFSLAAIWVGLFGYYSFLKHLQYLTQQWYYVALMAFSAVLIDILAAGVTLSKPWRIVRLCFLVAFVAASFLSARSVVRTRMTNVDLVVHWLEQNSGAGDTVLVTPWYCGITFSRYYRGAAEWTTIPPIEDHRFHRVDLLLANTTAPDQSEPMRPILERVERTLKAGHRVLIVGDLLFLPRNQVPPLLLPAPNDRFGWHDKPYYEAWSAQLSYFLQRHAGHTSFGNILASTPVNEFEDLPLIIFTGWNAGG